MALINPSNLFSGGNVRVDSTPYRVAYQQAEARKQAKDEALDKYYQQLPNTINAAGVRDQEVPVINEAKDKLMQYWMQNRDAIKKGNTPANYNYQKMIRETQGIIQESKNRSANNAKLAPYLIKPEYAYVRKNKNLMNTIAANDLPVGAEGSIGFNLGDLLMPPPPFDAAKYLNGVKIKPNPSAPIYEEVPGDRFNRLEITNKEFSPQDLNALHIQAKTEFDNNPSFETQIKENIAKDPALTKVMEDVFMKNYGHKIENDGDLATAYTLSLMDLTPTQKIVPNKQKINDEKNAEWDRRNAIAFQQSMKKIAANKSGSGGDEVDVYDIFSNIDNTTQDPNSAINVGGKRVGTRVNALNTDGQFVVLDFARKLTGNNDLGNDDIYIDRSSDGSIEVYRTPNQKKTADGTVPPFRKDKSTLVGVMKRVGTNIKAQPGAKEKRAVIQQGNNKSTPKKESNPLDLDLD